MLDKSPHFLEYQHVNDGDFSISIFEISKKLSGVVKRYYILSSGNSSTIRGNHAHLNQFQILVLMNGEAEVKLTSSNGLEVEFNLENKPLYIPNNYWIEVLMQPNSNILCLASEEYDNLKSVIDKQHFLKL